MNHNKKMTSVASPKENNKARDDSIQGGIKAGARNAVITAVVASVPTLTAARYVPWVKANLNHTGQALVISAASIAAFFITADKYIHERARATADYDKTS